MKPKSSLLFSLQPATGYILSKLNLFHTIHPISLRLSLISSSDMHLYQHTFIFIAGFSHQGPRCRWVDIIKMALRELGWGSMDWIDLAQDRDQRMALVITVMNLRVP
jgi:hypothetical protein